MKTLLRVVVRKMRRTVVASTTGERLLGLSPGAFVVLLILLAMMGLLNPIVFQF